MAVDMQQLKERERFKEVLMSFCNNGFWDRRYEWRREEYRPDNVQRENNKYENRRCNKAYLNKRSGYPIKQKRNLIMSDNSRISCITSCYPLFSRPVLL